MALEPFSEDHQAFRRTVRDFCERELAPHAREWDEQGEFPRALFPRFGELGLFGIRHDPAWGGSGLDWWYVVAYAEELVRCRNAGLAMAMLVHGEMAIPVIARRWPTTACSSTAGWATSWRRTWPGPGATCGP